MNSIGKVSSRRVYDGKTIDGDVATRINEFAAHQEVDLVVLTTHGHGGLSKLWFGSVADAVLRRATVPVLLVPASRSMR